MNHSNIRFYLTIGFFAFIGILFVWSKFLATPNKQPQNNAVQLNSSNQTTQAGTTDQDTKNLQAAIENRLKTMSMQVFSSGPPNASVTLGNLVQQVSVTKNSDGGMDVAVNLSIADTDPNSPFYDASGYSGNENTQGINEVMSDTYVGIYKYNQNVNIDNVTINANKFGQDNYGNQRQILLESTSMSKAEASNYNWSLDDNSLWPLIYKNLRPSFN